MKSGAKTQVLKRLRTVRERTKEGLFGSVPYSFMSSALRARYTVLFCLLWLVATCIQFFECIRVLKVPKKISIYVLHRSRGNWHVCIKSFSV